MTAWPPVWGSAKTVVPARIALFALGAAIGSVMVAVAVSLAREVVGKPPVWLLTIAGAVIAGVVIGVIPNFLPNSPWRVPAPWGARGHLVYPFTFGLILGVAFLTALPSMAFYALVLFALHLESFGVTAVVFVCFAAARVMPLLVGGIATFRDGDPLRSVDYLGARQPFASPVEALLVLTLAGIVIL